MKEKIKKVLFNIWILFIIVFLTCGTLEDIIQDMGPDLDHSWIYALHHMFIHGIEHGKDVIFPYGPLGFLFFAIAEPETYSMVWYGYLFSALMFIGGAFLLFLKTKKENSFNILLGFITVYVLGILTKSINFPFLIPLVFLLLREETKQKRYFFIACAAAAVAFLGKVGFGLLGAFTIFSYSIYKFFENIKPIDKKQIQITNDAKGMNIVVEVATGAIIYFATLIGIWFILYGNINHVLDFIIWSKEVSLGYAQTMVFIHEKPYWLLGATIVFYLIFPFFCNNKSLKIFHIITILSTLFFLKYSIVRHPGYILGYFISNILLFICFMKKPTKRTILYLLLVFFSTLYYVAGETLPGTLYKYYVALRNPIGLTVLRDEFPHNKLNFKILSDFRRARNHIIQLPQKSRDIIGKQTVDIFPWEQTFIYAHDFNWKPRFMFQSYMENTEALDGKTSELFQSEEAPEFILWHKQLYDFDGEYNRRGIMSVDRRYMFNEDPQTLYQILNNYIPVDNNKVSIIFKKTNTPQLPIKKEYPADNIVINEWTDIKDISDSIMLLKLYPQRTFFGKIMNILGPDVFSYIDYKFNDGSTIRFKFPLASTIKYGIWINPFIDKLNMPFDARKVIQIRIAVDNPKTLEPTIPATWVAIPYKNSKLKFDFTRDNKINNFEKIKDNLKYYTLTYSSIKDYLTNPPRETNIKITTKQKLILKKDKNYMLNVTLKSQSQKLYYPKNLACQFKPSIQYHSYPKEYTVILPNTDEEQEINIPLNSQKNTDFTDIQITCMNNNILFSDVKAKLYEY